MALDTRLGLLVTRLGTEFKAIRTLVGPLTSLTTTDKTSIVLAVNEVRAMAAAAAGTGGGASIDDTTATTSTTYSGSRINTLLSGKADTSHTHTTAQVTGLDTALSGKAALSHTHAAANITDFTAAAKLAVVNPAAAVTVTDQAWSAKKTNDEIVAARAALKTELLGPSADAALDTFKELQDAMAADDSTAAALAVTVGNKVGFVAQTLTAAQQLQARTNIAAQEAAAVGNTEQDLVAAFNAAIV